VVMVSFRFVAGWREWGAAVVLRPLAVVVDGRSVG
jgi:hypothetical protein